MKARILFVRTAEHQNMILESRFDEHPPNDPTFPDQLMSALNRAPLPVDVQCIFIGFFFPDTLELVGGVYAA